MAVICGILCKRYCEPQLTVNIYDLICSKKQLKQVIHCVNVNLSVRIVYKILSYGAVNIAFSFSAIAIFFCHQFPCISTSYISLHFANLTRYGKGFKKTQTNGVQRGGVCWSCTVWWSYTIYEIIQNRNKFTVHSIGETS